MHLGALTDYFNQGKFDWSTERERERERQRETKHHQRVPRALRALIDTETSERTASSIIMRSHAN